MSEYTVRFYAGPYSGRRTVDAEDEDHAIAIVRQRVRREMTLPMYADGYSIERGNVNDSTSEAHHDDD